MVKPMRVLICGIPNVGKSTLINTLVGKRSAKTGDEAGVTRTEQRLVLADDFYLYDTPGMLWPRIIVPQSGTHLSASGAVGRNAYDDQEVSLELLDNLKRSYPTLLIARYGQGHPPQAPTGVPAEDVLDAIGRQRGALVSGGRVDAQKAAELLIGAFRAALIGRITLETAAQFLQWHRAGLAADAVRRQEQERERPVRRPRRR